MNRNVFDVIITTYKRPGKVATLVNQLIPLSEAGKIGVIIVVDSSPVTITQVAFENNNCVEIVRSSHANQPYQRFLGVSKSQQSYVLFLDDDMEVLDVNFAAGLHPYMEDAYAGVNLLFKNDNAFLAGLKPSVFKKNRWGSALRRISGYAAVPDNTFGLAGVAGKRVSGVEIEYLNGGAFLGNRTLLFKGISSTLFDLFEKRMGGGEDRLIGFALSRHGKIMAHDQTYFYHNDQGNSVYTTNQYNFFKRIAFSRLFLSFEFARLTAKPKLGVFFHYQWFSMGRIMGLLFNFVAQPRKSKAQQVAGYIVGCVRAIFVLAPIYFLKREDRNQQYWNSEVSSDLHAASQPAVS